MSIELVTRAAKGAPLTNQEQDQNLLNLRAAIEGMAAGVFVASIDQDAETLDISFQFSDGSSQGPIVLPRVPVRVRGAWAAGTLYGVGDVFRTDTASYVVATAHQASTIEADETAGRIMLLANDAGTGGGTVEPVDAADVGYTDAEGVETTVELALRDLEAAGAGGGGGTAGNLNLRPFVEYGSCEAGGVYSFGGMYWMARQTLPSVSNPSLANSTYWLPIGFPHAGWQQPATQAIYHQKTGGTVVDLKTFLNTAKTSSEIQHTRPGGSQTVAAVLGEILTRLAALDGGASS